MDKEKFRTLSFKGYEGEMIDSKVTNGNRLFYNRNKPFEKDVNYYDEFVVTKEVTIPKGICITQRFA